MANNIRIFVYGSLREGFFNYDKYLKGNVISNELGRVKGIVYHLPHKGYPAIFEGEGYVEGEVMELSNYEQTMKALDEMEGFYGENNPKNEYNKRLVEVELANGTKELCYAYFYNKDNDLEFDSKAILVENGNWKSLMTK